MGGLNLGAEQQKELNNVLKEKQKEKKQISTMQKLMEEETKKFNDLENMGGVSIVAELNKKKEAAAKRKAQPTPAPATIDKKVVKRASEVAIKKQFTNRPRKQLSRTIQQKDKPIADKLSDNLENELRNIGTKTALLVANEEKAEVEDAEALVNAELQRVEEQQNPNHETPRQGKSIKPKKQSKSNLQKVPHTKAFEESD